MAELQLHSTLPLNTKPTNTISSPPSVPILGFGTCASSTCTQSALAALHNSYTHLDTAQIYKNESETGAAIIQSHIDPSSLFICSKLWEDQYTRTNALESVQGSRQKLCVDVIDLYLLHTPRPGRQARHEAWLGLQDAVERGLVRSIGVSNWAPRHIEQLMTEDGVHIYPAVNQVEFHPWNQQREIVKYCSEKGIVVVAYSPLTQGTRLKDPVITKLADKYGKTPAQIVLRWCLQQGVVVIPKSDREERIVENEGIFGWELTSEDCKIIDGLDEGNKGNVGEWDPFAWD